MRKQTPLVRQFGFDARRRRALLALVGLEAKDRARAAYLQKHVIVPHVDAIIDGFYRDLWRHPEAKKILARGFELAHLRATQRRYLLTLGIGFDRAGYFESRLRVGVAHARVPVPLSLYQAAYALLQRLILLHLPAQRASGRERSRPLVAFVVKIATLDMSLAIETYHAARVDRLRRSVDALRGKALALHRLAETDTFTGLASHARILTVLKRSLAGGPGRAVSLIIADVDRFKSLNDTHGHLIGDKVLQGVTARLRSAARRGDVIGRYGGDEFMIVLRNTSLATAGQVAERMRARVNAEPLDLNGRPVRASLSLGVAQARPGEDAEQLIQRADAALYRAKRGGRNAVAVGAGFDASQYAGGAGRQRCVIKRREGMALTG